ncbi:hypothetical protein D9M71_543450 [compost metagenome]
MIERALEHTEGHRFNVAVLGKTRVVDEDVQARQRCCNGRNVVCVLDVELQVAVAVEVNVVIGGAGPGAGDRHLRTCCLVRSGDAGPDAAGATGHQDMAIVVVKLKVRPVGLLSVHGALPPIGTPDCCGAMGQSIRSSSYRPGRLAVQDKAIVLKALELRIV